MDGKLWIGALLAMLLPAIGYGDEAKVAILDFGLIDTSLQGDMEGPNKDDLERLRETADKVRQAVDESELFEVVDNQPAAALIKELGDSYQYFYKCNGCDVRIAEKLGADYVLTGWSQKVSNLILNLNIVLREVPSGKDIIGSSADMRGNTDESYKRAAMFLVERRLLPEFAERQGKADQ